MLNQVDLFNSYVLIHWILNNLYLYIIYLDANGRKFTLYSGHQTTINKNKFLKYEE